MTMTARETADGLMDNQFVIPSDWRWFLVWELLRDAIEAALLAERKAALAEAAVVARREIPENVDILGFGCPTLADEVAAAILALAQPEEQR